VAALLATSANGIRAFAALNDRRDFPVYAVGDRTAEIARALGFAAVSSAEGDAPALARLVGESRRPADGTLLHAAGSARAGDLAGELRAAGFDVRSAVLYDARPVESLAPPVSAALASGGLDGVLLFSARTARHFAALLGRAGLTAAVARLAAYCLSQAVADALDGIRFRRVRVAAEPTRAALVAALSS
jgi:uroporphyrinogen-III synthase